SLLTTGSYHRQDPFRNTTPRLAIRPETALASQHRWSQSALRAIVGRLYSFHPRKGPGRGPPLAQLAAQRRRFAVGVLLPTPEQPPQPSLEWAQSSAQPQAIELAC